MSLNRLSVSETQLLWTGSVATMQRSYDRAYRSGLRKRAKLD